MRVAFDPTITLGVVVHLVVLVVALTRFFVKIERRIAESESRLDRRLVVLETRVTDLWRDFLKSGNGNGT